MVKIIYYDLETTNLRPLTGPNGIEIVQIGAVCKHTRNKKTQKLNIYLVPNREISAGATQVHGLTRDSLEFDDAFRPKQGLQVFMNFLEQQREYNKEKILLVAHNNYGFDKKVLINNLNRFNVFLPDGPNIFFYDSLLLMKKVKDMSNGNLTRISLNACLDYFFQEEQASPHSAFWDADDCRRICEHGAKKLGYGSYQHYILSNYNLVSGPSDSDSDSEY